MSFSSDRTHIFCARIKRTISILHSYFSLSLEQYYLNCVLRDKCRWSGVLWKSIVFLSISLSTRCRAVCSKCWWILSVYGLKSFRDTVFRVTLKQDGTHLQWSHKNRSLRCTFYDLLLKPLENGAPYYNDFCGSQIFEVCIFGSSTPQLSQHG